MAVTYGFYNALAHDRVYDAIQMSSIFDGIIRDGVFSTIGESLTCKASENGLVVNVGSGRAWFDHTWTLNDTDYPVEAEEAEVVLDRIDAIILEVNSAVEVRANSIKFLKGTPSSNPVRPTLTHNAEVNQYALAYVSIRAGQTTIFQSDITNVVGTDETPFVTGILQQLSIENLILQWENEFDRHFADFVATNEADFNTWSADMQQQYNAWMTAKMNEYAQWYANMQAEGDANLAEFDAWFQHMKDQLDSDAAGHLQAEIDQLALEAGKGSVLTVHTINTSLYGRTVTVRQNEQIQTALFDNTGTAVFDNMPYIGEISITSTDGTQTATTTMNIPYFGRYSVNIAFWAATANINTTSSEFYGLPITVAKDGVTAGSTSFDNAGHATYIAMAPGTYKFTVNYDGMDFDSTIAITEEATYTVILNAWTAQLDIVTSVTELLSRPITIKKGETIVGTTNFDSSGNATYKVHQTGTYTIVSTDTLGNTYQESVVVTDETVYEVSLGLPNGETCLPINDIPTWLQCGEIFNKNYTMLAEVLADEECFAELLGNSNACAYMARSTDWASTITTNERAMEMVGMFDVACKKLLANEDWLEAIVNCDYTISVLNSSNPKMTSNTTPSGTCFASSTWPGYDAYKSFTWVADGGWCPYNNETGYIGYDFGKKNPIKYLKHIYADTEANKTFYLQGSDDGSSYTNILTINTEAYKGTWDFYELDSEVNYRYYRLYGSYTATNNNCRTKLILMGRNYISDTYIPLVPTMTSNTTPEGVCTSYNGSYGSGYEAYKAFDRNDSTRWVSGVRQSASEKGWIEYDFTSEVKIDGYRVKATTASDESIPKVFKLQAWVNDAWVDLDTYNGSVVSSFDYIKDIPDNQYVSSKYRIYVEEVTTSSNNYLNIGEIQLYSKYTKGIIHSAANDTIYYTSEGTNVPVATTDANGVGELDFASLTPGTYTLYSTVAKDPNNTSNPYSMQVKVTKNTKEVYFMPLNFLYWYGNTTDKLDGSYASTSGYSPTYYTNYISLVSPGVNKQVGLGTKKVTTKQQNFIFRPSSGRLYYADSTATAGTLVWNKSVNGLETYENIGKVIYLTAYQQTLELSAWYE